jgi:hypothetical protein
MKFLAMFILVSTIPHLSYAQSRRATPAAKPAKPKHEVYLGPAKDLLMRTNSTQGSEVSDLGLTQVDAFTTRIIQGNFLIIAAGVHGFHGYGVYYKNLTLGYHWKAMKDAHYSDIENMEIAVLDEKVYLLTSNGQKSTDRYVRIRDLNSGWQVLGGLNHSFLVRLKSGFAIIGDGEISSPDLGKIFLMNEKFEKTDLSDGLEFVSLEGVEQIKDGKVLLSARGKNDGRLYQRSLDSKWVIVD